MSDTGFRFFLREETRAAHNALDELVGPLETLESYSVFVAGLYRFRGAIEAALRDLDWPAAFGGWRPLYIDALLAADLIDLDRSPVRPAATRLSNDIASLLGVSYVLEGSALGARLISRRAAALGLNDRYGARHLAAQTAELTNWRAFLNLAENLAENPPGVDRPRAVQAANESFAAAAAAMRMSAP